MLQQRPESLSLLFKAHQRSLFFPRARRAGGELCAAQRAQRPRPSERTAGRIQARRTELAAGSTTEGLPKEDASWSLTAPRAQPGAPRAAAPRAQRPAAQRHVPAPLRAGVPPRRKHRYLTVCFTHVGKRCAYARSHATPTSMSQQSCRTYCCRALPSRRAQRGAERPHAAPAARCRLPPGSPVPEPPAHPLSEPAQEETPQPTLDPRPPPPPRTCARPVPGRPPSPSYPIGSSVFWPHRWPRGRLPFHRDSPL